MQYAVIESDEKNRVTYVSEKSTVNRLMKENNEPGFKEYNIG